MAFSDQAPTVCETLTYAINAGSFDRDGHGDRAPDEIGRLLQDTLEVRHMGLANIAANNGWSMAFLGAGIVMTGLIILSLAISQIHKVVELWEKRKKKAAAPAAVAEPVAEEPASVEMASCPVDLDGLAAHYQSLTEPLGLPFELKELYRVAGASNLPHPHITIRCFREAGLLVTEGNGLFSWKR